MTFKVKFHIAFEGLHAGVNFVSVLRYLHLICLYRIKAEWPHAEVGPQCEK